jgi:hypothetical protein
VAFASCCIGRQEEIQTLLVLLLQLMLQGYCAAEPFGLVHAVNSSEVNLRLLRDAY